MVPFGLDSAPHSVLVGTIASTEQAPRSIAVHELVISWQSSCFVSSVYTHMSLIAVRTELWYTVSMVEMRRA